MPDEVTQSDKAMARAAERGGDNLNVKNLRVIRQKLLLYLADPLCDHADNALKRFAEQEGVSHELIKSIRKQATFQRELNEYIQNALINDNEMHMNAFRALRQGIKNGEFKYVKLYLDLVKSHQKSTEREAAPAVDPADTERFEDMIIDIGPESGK